jgi:Mor family transcriptional regulator
MKKSDAKIIEKLPGDLRELAELIGVEKTLLVVERWGGSYILVPKCDDIKREIRIAEAQKIYDRGGVTIRDLALKFQVTDRTMKTWLKLEAEDVPAPLLELMDRT